MLNTSERTIGKPLQDDNLEAIPCLPLDEAYISTASSQDMQKEIIGLYHNINVQLANTSTKMIQFIASQPGEGTSTLTREFARFVSGQLNQLVYLLDASTSCPQHIINSAIRQECRIKPPMHSQSLPVRTGHACEGSLSVVCPISMLESSLTTLFSSPRINRDIENLKQHFDFILIDSPSLSTSTDALAPMRRADGIILIVDAENTRWSVVNNAKDTILRAGGRILGIVLNKRKYHIPSFIYRRLC